MFTILRRTILSILLVGAMTAMAPSTTNAQSAKNAAYVELAGNGLLYTVNYERAFSPSISGRLGLMTFSVSASGSDQAGNDAEGSATINLIPIMGNYFIGGNHRLELGGGPLIVRASASAETAGFEQEESGLGIGGTATVGYRYQQPDGGFVFRIGLTPLITSSGVLPWAGLSLGYAF